MSSLFSHAFSTVGGFVLALGLLVFFHELGHYVVARLCGVKVLRFSLGFGPVLWSRRRGADQTEWAVSAIPLGGYVRMLDEREGEVAPADLPRAFNRQTLGRRAAVVAAGPAANLLLATLLFAASNMIGVPGVRPYLDTPAPGTSAAQAGVQAGDLVLTLGQQPVSDWNALRLGLAGALVAGQPLDLTIQKAGGGRVELALHGDATLAGADGDPAAALGLQMWQPPLVARLGSVLPDGAARRQGLLSGDLVVAVNGEPVVDWSAFVARVRAAPGVPLQLEVQRDGQRLPVAITPDRDDSGVPAIGRIGAAVAVDAAMQARMTVLLKYAPGSALMEGARHTWQLSRMTVTMLARMLTGTASSKGVGGPLQIASAAGETVRMGLVPFLGFLGVISVSLGVLNLLPVPVLDGGHLLYYSFELVTGRPLPERLMMAGMQVGAFMLAMLMLLAFYNDFNRFFSG